MRLQGPLKTVQSNSLAQNTEFTTAGYSGLWPDQLGFERLKDGSSTTPLGKLLQVLTILSVKSSPSHIFIWNSEQIVCER